MTPAPDLTARPLGLAEVIDRSIALTVRHFRALFLAMLAVQVPAVLLARRLSGVDELLSAATDPARAAPFLAGALLGLLWLLAALLALQLVATAAAAAVVGPTLDPRPGAARPGWRQAALATATASLLQLLLLAAAPALGMLPGLALALRAREPATLVVGMAGALLGGLSAFLVVTLRLMLVPAVAALEGRGGARALARSARLMSPRPGTRLLERPAIRASLVLLAIFVLSLAVNALAGLPRLLAMRALGGGSGLDLLAAQLPLWLDLALSVLEAVAGAALQPFPLVAVAVFYFDRRARTEALDVELWAAALEGGG